MTIETKDVVARLHEWLKATAELAQSPGVDPAAFMELVGKGAAGLLTEVQSLSDRIAVLEARRHGGDHGAAGDAVDFACDHCAPDEALAFLEDWRSGQTSEWPGYVKWLAVQRAGAAEARTQNTPDSERTDHGTE